MSTGPDQTGLKRTIALIPWYQLLNNLLFWQAVWFLYFQSKLSGAEAIILYTVYDISVTVMEVPSGYFSDRIGRRWTLMLSAVCALTDCIALAIGGSFAMLAAGQCLLGAGSAFKSGTDSSLLYESLTAAGRSDDIEAQEVRVWRFSLTGLALSAVIGGAMSLWSPVLPFYATAAAFALVLLLVILMQEPPARAGTVITVRGQLGALRLAFLNPVLTWLFLLAVLMYAFSHLPFVFGQPFILTTPGNYGLTTEAPLVSGMVTSAMMIVAALASLIALGMRRRLGLPLLLFAFGLQIALAGALALSTSALVIGVLLLRMVPDSLSGPFITARVQPLLEDSTRATYLSLKSLGEKVFFAATLLLAATSATDAGLLPADDLQRILGWYTAGGLACIALLAVTARYIAIEPCQNTA